MTYFTTAPSSSFIMTYMTMQSSCTSSLGQTVTLYLLSIHVDSAGAVIISGFMASHLHPYYIERSPCTTYVVIVIKRVSMLALLVADRHRSEMKICIDTAWSQVNLPE